MHRPCSNGRLYGLPPWGEASKMILEVAERDRVGGP